MKIIINSTRLENTSLFWFGCGCAWHVPMEWAARQMDWYETIRENVGNVFHMRCPACEEKNVQLAVITQRMCDELSCNILRETREVDGKKVKVVHVRSVTRHQPDGWNGESFNDLNAHAEIVKNQYIRLYVTHPDDDSVILIERTYRLGDQAEYDSYNLSYYGPIVAIGEKTVTISEPYHGSKRRFRLSLEKFFGRNIRFDVIRASARNHDAMMYL